jgi:hypothetical protein
MPTPEHHNGGDGGYHGPFKARWDETAGFSDLNIDFPPFTASLYHGADDSLHLMLGGGLVPAPGVGIYGGDNHADGLNGWDVQFSGSVIASATYSKSLGPGPNVTEYGISTPGASIALTYTWTIWGSDSPKPDGPKR